MAFLSLLVFVAVIAVLVLLSDPPGEILAIIAVVVVGVLVSALLPAGVLGRGRRRRVTNRAAADQPQRTMTDPTTDAAAAQEG